MKLVLSEEELEKLILEWAEPKWPGMFNKVEFDTCYSSIRSVTLSKEKKEQE